MQISWGRVPQGRQVEGTAGAKALRLEWIRYFLEIREACGATRR